MKNKIRSVYGFIKEVYLKFSGDHGTFLAATIAYYALLSLFPLILVLVSIAGFDLVRGGTINQLIDLVNRTIPQFSDLIKENIEAVVATRGEVGIIGIIGLLWVGTAVFDALEYALDQIWGKSESKLLFRARLLGVVVVIGIVFILILTSLFFPILQIIRDVWLGILSGDTDVSVLNPYLWIFNVFIVIGVFGAIYHFVPSKRPPVKDIWKGAVTAGIIWELARRVFSWYLKRVSGFTAIYGSLGIVVGFLLWLYILAIITIFGSEVAAIISKRKKE